MLISPRAVREYLARPLDSFLWVKKLTREQIERELRQLKVRPVFKTEPWLHQLVCFYIGLSQPEFLYLLDMGLGKTKILLDLLTQSLRERRVERGLITVPRIINTASWVDDVRVHSDLEPHPVMVENIEAKWEFLSRPRGDLTIIDYQSLVLAVTEKRKKGKGLDWNERKLRKLQRLYQFIGIDESHKLKSHDNLWFAVMRQLTKHASHVYASTGTLFGRDPEDLWSQFYLVDRGETFGENLGLFRGSFFKTKTHPWKGVTYSFDHTMTWKLNRMLQHRSVRYDEDEVQDLPAKIVRQVYLDMPEDTREHYLRSVEGLVNAGGDPRKLDAPWIRMRQISSGYLKWTDDYGPHHVIFKQNPKLDLLERLLDEMGDNKIVVVYWFTDTGALLCEKLRELRIPHQWFYGGTKNKPEARRKFIEDPECRAFVMQAEAGGTGTDGLQKVARYLYFYESPSDPTTRKQTEKRLHRPGMLGRVFIYDAIYRRCVDKGILDSIAEGRDLYESVVNGRAKKSEFLTS